MWPVGCGAYVGLVYVGVFGGTLEEELDIAGEDEGCIFHRMVIDQVIQFGPVIFGLCVERFDRMGVNTDCGGIG